MKTKRNAVVPQHFIHLVLAFLLVCVQFVPAANMEQANPEQQIMKWHKMTLSFDGPQTSETADPNPFLNYRMEVTFTHPATKTTFVVPGYYAADGNAANTSASEGSKWLVHFAANQTGQWNYQVSFRQGDQVAVSDDRNAGQNAGFCDGQKGSFTVMASDKTGRDFRGKGRLHYVGKHHLQFADSKEFFLKAGADAPENLFSYADFDGDFKTDGQKDNLVKTWQPHIADWKAGDPAWGDGKGKGLIGAINYLASKGMNVFSFLTMNIEGDDRNVFPYLNYNERLRMDVSRLAQWEVIFEHADKLGMYLHFKTQETENDQLLDGGELGVERKLYYRELIARFSHHLALNWNFGEENTNTPEQMRSFTKFFKDNDPYNHLRVLHTFPGDKKKVYPPLLGPVKANPDSGSDLTGASLQSGPKQVPDDTRTWVKQSAEAGQPWVVANDEQGSADTGVVPDADDPGHDVIRNNVLWGNITGGGAGVELYFGYKFAHSDLTCQDFRSRDIMWDQCRYALEFFSNNKIPFQDMTCMDSLVSNNNWCLAKPGQVYVVYLKDGGQAQLDLEGYKADYSVKWYNPRAGGKLLDGSAKTINAAGKNDLGNPPADADKDWVVLVQTKSGAAVASTVAVKKETQDQPIVLSAIVNFDTIAVEGFVPAYKDPDRGALAINAVKFKDKFAAAETPFTGQSGTYNLVLSTLTEMDGESSYKVVIDGKIVGEFTNPEAKEDYEVVQFPMNNITVNKDSKVRVEFIAVSNKKVKEGSGTAYSRGRWTTLAFLKDGQSAPVQAVEANPATPAIPPAVNAKLTDPATLTKGVELVFEEVDGLVAVEAEHFIKQSKTEKRQWYITTAVATPDLKPDPDGNHAEAASGKAYLEILPDTRTSNSEKLISGENYSDTPGEMTVIDYHVYFNTPGRYYVWVRACSTGAEDNSVHAGIDGTWPQTGQRMQWCDGKKSWRWESKQRTQEQHCGEPYKIYLDVQEAGLHTIHFSLREDGFEMDKFLLTQNRDFVRPENEGPAFKLKK